MEYTKRKIISVLAVGFYFISIQEIQAQTCTPLDSISSQFLILPIPYLEEIPGSGIQDTACEGQLFETTFNFRVPSQLQLPFGTLPVNSINMATTGAIANLPASMTYVCNPPNCIFQKETIGCVLVYGTANAPDVGMHNLIITVLLKTIADIPFSLPDQSLVKGVYALEVRSAGEAFCKSTSLLGLEKTELQVFPNPAQNTIFIGSTTADYAEILDLNGRLVLKVNKPSDTIDIQSIPSGIYYLRLTTESQSLTTRLIKV